MRYYCTYFDRNYLLRGYALIDSLNRSENKSFTIFIICMDEITRVLLTKLNLKNTILIPFHEIEQNDNELLATREDRTTAEYFWTCTPTIILRIIEKYPEIDCLTYLDSDLLFFSSPDPLFEELGQDSVLIHEHRFTDHLKHLEPQNGTYNVGLVSFKNDQPGLAVLKWWREKCLEWCYARYEDGKMGDQLYLNSWPDEFEGVRVLQHIGGGVAPWNHIDYKISKDPKDTLLVDNLPVIFYHFQSFSLKGEHIFVPVKHVTYPLTEKIISSFFIPYIELLETGIKKIKEILPDFSFGFSEDLELSNLNTFMVRSYFEEQVNQLSPEQQSIRFGDWTCYRSNQYLEEGVIPTMEKPKNDFKFFDQEENILGEDQLLLKFYKTDLARSIKTIYFVGAHIYQERELISTVFPELDNIYLFEPIPPFYEELKKLEQIDGRIKVFPYAISDKDGTASFYITDNNGASSSLLKFNKHTELFPHVHQDQEIIVETRSIDSLIKLLIL